MTWHHLQFFLTFFVFLVKFSYWSKSHVNIITGSGVMTISFYKGLTRNLEIGNTSLWVLPNIRRLGRVKNTKFGTNISNKMSLKAALCYGCFFYRFWVIKGKPTGGKITFPSTQTMVELSNNANPLFKINREGKSENQSCY